ncbi:type II secretory pathway pseudopilin PulG [Paraburkholderia bannensis]|uniref:Type II secretory pathway pseudopilin PulG n=1 Tax=Paraburkholderia bannensis TaxID=765414 RepID=A0A7W9U4A5_9BURK|nr:MULTISPECIES: hypothetical protein [Paraburkholderia]MBB3260959.1 type II secretory pathway pseudopilin PulG [Paraburkholderia sp. WP4_3_2]MBB6105996.1 type II secretory pathway pseudopilin PulG [Paraburkholderia bannensis]
MADHADYADNAENESSEAGRSARGTTSRRRAASPDATIGAPLDAQPAEPTLDLFGHAGDGPVPEFVGATQGVSPKVSRAMASLAARRAARQKTAPLAQEAALDPVLDPAEPFFHADPLQPDASAQPAHPAAVADEADQALAPASAESAPAAEAVETPKPAEIALEAAAKPANGFSYAPTSASGSPAHLNSVVHASDFEAAVHGPVHEHADKTSRADLAGALAVQARRTRWMLTAAVAALVVTTLVAVVETAMLANFSADSQAQQQRIELLLQNQQAALDKLTARLDAPPPVETGAAAAASVAAPAAAAPARAQSASAPTRHAARAARAKAAEKAEKDKSASHAAAKAHAQSGTHQTTKN